MKGYHDPAEDDHGIRLSQIYTSKKKPRFTYE